MPDLRLCCCAHHSKHLHLHYSRDTLRINGGDKKKNVAFFGSVCGVTDGVDFLGLHFTLPVSTTCFRQLFLRIPCLHPCLSSLKLITYHKTVMAGYGGGMFRSFLQA